MEQAGIPREIRLRFRRFPRRVAVRYGGVTLELFQRFDVETQCRVAVAFNTLSF